MIIQNLIYFYRLKFSEINESCQQVWKVNPTIWRMPLNFKWSKVLIYFVHNSNKLSIFTVTGLTLQSPCKWRLWVFLWRTLSGRNLSDSNLLVHDTNLFQLLQLNITLNVYYRPYFRIYYTTIFKELLPILKVKAYCFYWINKVILHVYIYNGHILRNVDRKAWPNMSSIIRLVFGCRISACSRSERLGYTSQWKISLHFFFRLSL